jgi:hypothetical protein
VSQYSSKNFIYLIRQGEGQCPESCRIHKATDKVGGSLLKEKGGKNVKKEL